LTRLSKEAIERAKLSLSGWQAPDTLLVIPNSVPSSIFHRQAGLEFLRDAWIAGEFAKARNADAVRLVSDEWPDFELRFGETIEQFEAVEADDPERKRGLEYTADKIGKVEHDPVENWIARAEAAPGYIRVACERKAAKRYAGRAHLVVYLSNAGEYGIRQKEVEASFFDATKPAHGLFDTVWVLWGGKAYRV
jgi:hypothetical protein